MESVIPLKTKLIIKIHILAYFWNSGFLIYVLSPSTLCFLISLKMDQKSKFCLARGVSDYVLGIFNGRVKVLGPSPRHIKPCCEYKAHLVKGPKETRWTWSHSLGGSTRSWIQRFQEGRGGGKSKVLGVPAP